MEETSRRQRRMEASPEGGQGPEGAVAPYMDGFVVWLKNSYCRNSTFYLPK
jgi:hypothetical protein